ncbi:hypothetical protein LV84_00017 [Algoriphagus ratkowskyi]|uniref:Outer membrane protein with beta-barrel domain n=1 Tax=Algoriphagus ratkowskyi TaxID=57028 RepID=A0A2W7S289_9BACT|nr:hypothetical protein [Algoriphagus ratkowskyi]PZX61029.1 hypothetical protein LV84_00017 [Algoriphagus ratkowskyi]TXD79167.1 hypothetical protein ESW18_02715 [Algoriphagus ratkowskyi]
MKTSLLPLLLFFLCISQALAQGEPDTVIYTKSKVISAFGNSWTYKQQDDGKWILEIQENDEVEISEIHKKSRFTAGLDTEIGINQVIPSDQMPTVKPWGSWYYAINVLGKTKVSKNFQIYSSIGVNWYNFKLEDRSLIAVKTPEGIVWEEFAGPGTGTKSKISASYLNFTLVPTILTNNQKLRLGLGGYAGLRIGGRGKFVYDDVNGEKQKQFEKSNMYVENLRYGARAEIGVADVTLFFNYDLNNLFQENLGPEVQALSFGVTIR